MNTETQPSASRKREQLVSQEAKIVSGINSQEDFDEMMASIALEAEAPLKDASSTPLDKKYPQEAGLIDAETKKLVAEFISKVKAANEGTVPPAFKKLEEKYPGGAWTEDRVAALRAKMAKRGAVEATPKISSEEEAEQKAQGERFRAMGELTTNLMEEDNKLNTVINQMESGEITGAQEKTIETLDKFIEAKLIELKVSAQERFEILKLLPNFIKAKKTVLEFHINRDEATAATMEKNYKQGKIQGEVDPSTKKVIPPKRIDFLRLKAKKSRAELQRYNIAA